MFDWTSFSCSPSCVFKFLLFVTLKIASPLGVYSILSSVSLGASLDNCFNLLSKTEENLSFILGNSVTLAFIFFLNIFSSILAIFCPNFKNSWFPDLDIICSWIVCDLLSNSSAFKFFTPDSYKLWIGAIPKVFILSRNSLESLPNIPCWPIKPSTLSSKLLFTFVGLESTSPLNS